MSRERVETALTMETAGKLQLNLVTPSPSSLPKYPKYDVTGESSVAPTSKDTAENANKHTGGTASTSQEAAGQEAFAPHSFPGRPESPMVGATASQAVLAAEPESAVPFVTNSTAAVRGEGTVMQPGTNASTEAATKGSTPADKTTSGKTSGDVTSSTRLNVDGSSGAEVVGHVARKPELSHSKSTTTAADKELPHPSSSEYEDCQPAKPLGKERSCVSGMPPSSPPLARGKEDLAILAPSVSNTAGNEWLADLSSSDDEEVDEEEELEDTIPPDHDFLGL